MFPFFHYFDPVTGYFLATLSLILRYAFVAGGAYFIFYQMKRQKWGYLKIQQGWPKASQILMEMGYSLATILIFALLGGILYFLHEQDLTLIYTEVEDYSWSYLFCSSLLLILIHDAYFYWMHRLIHQPRWFNFIHRIHHLSRNPTPWAALCFHPLEAFLELAIVPIVAFIMPLHPYSLVLFGLWVLVWNVIGHLGFELFPSGFTRHPFFRWFNTSTHHNLHHKYSRCNYGLYFNFWDSLLKTNHSRYHEIFEGVVSRKDSRIDVSAGEEVKKIRTRVPSPHLEGN